MALRRWLAASLALTTAFSPVSTAAVSAEADLATPGEDVCAAYGFRGPPPRPQMSRALPMIAPSPAPPPPPPPPVSAQAPVAVPTIPPLPLPPVARRAPSGAAAVEEMVVVTGGRLRADRPAPRDTERYPGAQANPIKRTADDPVSTFSIDVDTAAYANVRRFLSDGQRPPTDAVRVEELLNYFDYAYPRPTDRAQPFEPFVAVVPSPWSRERQILHVALQGYDVARAQQPPLNLVFLIDTSGSMGTPDRLPLAKRALGLLIDQLRPEDRVSIVAYAGAAGAVLGPTDGRQKVKMRCALSYLESGGSTAGGRGLALAYDLAQENFDPKAVNRVILMTDGDFNVGVSDPAKLKDFVSDKRKTGVYLSVYGFGRGNYNDSMMQTLAQNGNGTAAYVDGLPEARKLFRNDFTKSLFPIADDVKIQVEFNPARVSEYRLIGYETRMLAREDFNNDQVDAGEVGAAASVTALYEIAPSGAPGSSDPLRYGRAAPPATAGSELAYLKIRYKLPREARSRLIERPIGGRDTYPSLQPAPQATRWAVAVAGFGQLLRRDPRIDAGFGWNEVVALAQSARGDDPFGERAEFVQLARSAGEARGVNE